MAGNNRFFAKTIEMSVGQRIGSTTVVLITDKHISYQCDCGEVMQKGIHAQPAYKCKDCSKKEFSTSLNNGKNLALREYTEIERLMLKEASGKATAHEKEILKAHRAWVKERSDAKAKQRDKKTN